MVEVLQLSNLDDFLWIGYDVKQTKDSGYILVGMKSWVCSGTDKEQGIWVLKTDEVCNYEY